MKVLNFADLKFTERYCSIAANGGGFAAGLGIVAVSDPMTMHIKKRKFYENEKQFIKRSTW